MPQAIIRCKRCEKPFLADLKRCPSCGKLSPDGTRELLLKWLAILSFALMLAYIGYLIIRSRGQP